MQKKNWEEIKKEITESEAKENASKREPNTEKTEQLTKDSETKKEKTVTVIDGYVLNVRSAPDSNASLIGEIHKGDKVICQGDLGKTWSNVTLSNGKSGYALSEYLRVLE